MAEEKPPEAQWNGLDTQGLKRSSNTPYLIAVVLMVALAITAVVTITVIRPDRDNSSLYALIFASIGPTTLALLAFMKAQETHLSVNSRLEQFIRNAGRASRAEGELAGLAAADKRADSLKKDE